MKCRHIWRNRSWHHMDRKWYCQPCLLKRAKQLTDQFRAYSRMDVWFKDEFDRGEL